MKRKLQIARQFKTDDGAVHILYLARISSHTNIFDISKSKK